MTVLLGFPLSLDNKSFEEVNVGFALSSSSERLSSSFVDAEETVGSAAEVTNALGGLPSKSLENIARKLMGTFEAETSGVRAHGVQKRSTKNEACTPIEIIM